MQLTRRAPATSSSTPDQWIFGKKVMLPAGVIRDVDLDSEKVFVDRSKDEIKNSPEFNEDTYRDTTYRDELGGYYGKRDNDELL